MNIINGLLKHPFINKTGLASSMRPKSDREAAQKTINARIANDTEHPEEDVLNAIPELKNLHQIIKKIIEIYEKG